MSQQFLIDTPRCSVIVCSMNGSKVLPACLASVLGCTGVPFEVIVVDNGSTDSAPEMVARDFPAVRLIREPENLGFGGGNNVGMQVARGEILILLNDDTEVPADWLAELVKPFDADERVGVVGCKLLYPGGKTIQHAGAVIYPNGNTMHVGVGEEDRGQHDQPCAMAYVTGAALALRRGALEQVGLLDPAFFPIYFEEVDLQVRMARAGWKIWYQPSAWMIHHESQTQGAGSARFVFRYTRNRMLFLAFNGLQGGRWEAAKCELRWLVNIAKAGRLLPVLKAYTAGLANWRAWRLQRRTRPTVPKLGGMQK